MGKEITLSCIKADIGGFVGHGDVHPRTREVAIQEMQKAKDQGLLLDFCQAECGDDISLILSHRRGIEDAEIHEFAWKTFEAMTQAAKELKLYGAGQDLLADSFSGNLKGLGPGFAEISFEERPSEPVIFFIADKTHPGAWNYYLYKIFADPFNTPGLVIDPKASQGFLFEVHDLVKGKKITFDCPAELYRMLAFIGTPGRYVIKYVYTKQNEPVASTSTQKLSHIAGRYVGKDDPVMIVRAQSGLPAVGEVLEPFAYPALVAGWMRGSHNGPLMPVGTGQDTPSRFDGPPRVAALGFQVADGKLNGPRDMFGDVAFDNARKQALEVADYLRRMGPFEPHRLPTEDMEYTAMPTLMAELDARFEDIEDKVTALSPGAQRKTEMEID